MNILKIKFIQLILLFNSRQLRNSDDRPPVASRLLQQQEKAAARDKRRPEPPDAPLDQAAQRATETIAGKRTRCSELGEEKRIGFGE